MDSFEQRFATALKAASPEPPGEFDPDRITRTRRGRARVVAPVAAGLVVLATAGVVAAVVADRGGGHSGGPSSHRSHRGVPSSHSSAAATPLPSAPAGFAANEFRMAPVAQPVYGGPAFNRPTCGAAQITGTAVTRSTDGGVLGVVRLRGAIVEHDRGDLLRCSLPIGRGPSELLDARGRSLGIPLSAGDTADPPANGRSDIPLTNGDAIWGFAWFGSHCGAKATSVEIPLEHGAGSIRIPLQGPQPACAQRGGSVLIDGIAGQPGEPVQPARPEYRNLQLTGRFDGSTTKFALAPIVLTLRATGTAPITLDPCPAYAGRDWATRRDGGPDFSDPIDSGDFPCTARRVLVSAGRPLRVTVPAVNLTQAGDRGAIPGTTISVDIGIAGVPQLHLTTTVH